MNATSRAIAKHADDLERELAEARAHLLVAESELGVARSLTKEALDQVAAKDAALRFFADDENWRLNGPLDPNSGNFIGRIHARAALAAPARETE